MKNDNYTREELYTRIFSHLPEVPKGKELTEILWLRVAQGGIYLDPTNSQWTEWTPINMSADKVPVAQFRDTHREDGTPMDIEPLPVVEGYRVEYFGTSLKCRDMEIASGYIYFNRRWQINMDDKMPMENETLHYARLFKIVQPTTLEDLVGSDGQKSVWIFYTEHSIHRAKVSLLEACKLAVDNWSIRALANKECRWSHSPFTPFKEANKFVL